jgi:hypothetical protein
MLEDSHGSLSPVSEVFKRLNQQAINTRLYKLERYTYTHTPTLPIKPTFPFPAVPVLDTLPQTPRRIQA